MVYVAPSILSADFARLGEEIRDVEQGGADFIHIDVMDGHFVPNLTIGPLVVEAVRPITELPLDVHLMIEAPDRYIPAFAKAGADILSVHVEACPHLHRTIQHTPVQQIEHVLEDLDLVLLMTVNPGFGGQSFISSVLPKIRQVKEMAEQKGLADLLIEVDGGVNKNTARQCIEAGANLLVAGSAVYNEKDRKKAISDIKGALG